MSFAKQILIGALLGGEAHPTPDWAEAVDLSNSSPMPTRMSLFRCVNRQREPTVRQNAELDADVAGPITSRRWYVVRPRGLPRSPHFHPREIEPIVADPSDALEALCSTRKAHFGT